jgi:hypothetical protein
MFDDDREPIDAALEGFLKTGFLDSPPPDYMPRDIIFYAHPYEHKFNKGTNKGKVLKGTLNVLIAADAPTAPNKSLMILAIQPPVSLETAQRGVEANCHLSAEIYPAAKHTIIPLTYEFSRGTTPGKRLNYTAKSDGAFSLLQEPKPGEIRTGFDHFISVEYSQFGIFNMDFNLTVRHHDLQNSEFAPNVFPISRENFESQVRREIRGPLEHMERQINADKGISAPKRIDPKSFFEKISARMPEAAYGTLDIFREEIESNINPNLLGENYIEDFAVDVEVPVEVVSSEEESAPFGKYFPMARTLVQYSGALESVFMLADRGPIPKNDTMLLTLLSGDGSLETITQLNRVGLLDIDGDTLGLTEFGKALIPALRDSLLEDERLDG